MPDVVILLQERSITFDPNEGVIFTWYKRDVTDALELPRRAARILGEALLEYANGEADRIP